MGLLTEMLRESFKDKLNEAIEFKLNKEILKKLCTKPVDKIYDKLGYTGVCIFHYPKNSKHPDLYWLCICQASKYWACGLFYDADHDKTELNRDADQEPDSKQWPSIADEKPDVKGGWISLKTAKEEWKVEAIFSNWFNRNDYDYCT